MKKDQSKERIALLKRIFSKTADAMLLSILWVVYSLPIFTMGASLTALYYTMHKCLYQNRSYVGTEFRRSFRENFRRVTPIWLLSLAVYGVMGVDLYLISSWEASAMRTALRAIFVIVILVCVFWNIQLFPFLARFDNPPKQAAGNAWRLLAMHFKETLLIFLLILGSLVLTAYFMPAILLLPSIDVAIVHTLLDKYYYKYMSDEDREIEIERSEPQ